MSTKTLEISIPTDENGMLGRECPDKGCERFFKIKPGTGLSTSDMICPYCERRADLSEFTTKEQLEYAQSIAIKQIAEPLLGKFKRNVESLNRGSNGLFALNFSVAIPRFNVKDYREEEVETEVICDSCGLEFSVFGIFASCPDCGRLNAFAVLEKSFEVSTKRLKLANQGDAKK